VKIADTRNFVCDLEILIYAQKICLVKKTIWHGQYEKNSQIFGISIKN